MILRITAEYKAWHRLSWAAYSHDRRHGRRDQLIMRRYSRKLARRAAQREIIREVAVLQ